MAGRPLEVAVCTFWVQYQDLRNSFCPWPPIPAFNSLRADLPRRIAAITEDTDYAAFVDLTDTVLELDTIFWSSSQPQASHPPRVPTATVPSLPAVPTASPAVPDPSNVPKKDQSCGNCKSRGLRGIGHTDGTCFQPGGGMEGRRDEYMANKGRVHAMIAEYLENTFSVSEQPLPSDDVVISHSPDIPPLPDSDLFPPPIANLSVTPFSINSDFRGDLYIPCDPKFPSYVALASTALHVRRHVRMRKLYDTARLRATVARDQTARVRSKQLVY